MHFVIIGGDGVQLLGGYIPPIPPCFGTAGYNESDIFCLNISQNGRFIDKTISRQVDRSLLRNRLVSKNSPLTVLIM